MLATVLLQALLGGASAQAAGLADAPWPMLQGDARHTGRSAFVGPSRPALKWRFELEGQPGAPAIGPDGVIYLPVGSVKLNRDRRGFLYAINPDGTLRWRHEFAPRPGDDPKVQPMPGITAPAIADDGTIYVHTNAGSNDQSVSFIAGPSDLFAINPNGTEKWVYRFNAGAAVLTSPGLSSPAVAPDGTIYVGSTDTGLYAINPAGTEDWVVSPEASSIGGSPAVGSDGTVYIIVSDLHAYEPDGDFKWTADLGNSCCPPTSPSIASDGTIYGCGGPPNAQCHAVSPAGTKLWSFPVAGTAPWTPALSSDGTIYFDTTEHFYAVNPDGSQRWRFAPGTFDRAEGSPLVGADGRIYARKQSNAPDFRTRLEMLNPDGTESGSAFWDHESTQDELNPAIGADGTLYLPEFRDSDPFTGRPRSAALGAYVQGPPPPPPAVPPARDTTLRVRVSAKRFQRVLRQRGIVIVVVCPDEPCAARAGGSVSVPSARRASATKRYRLRSVRRNLRRGVQTRLRLRFSSRLMKRVRRALRSPRTRRRVSANVSLRVADAAGNTQNRRLAIKLRR